MRRILIGFALLFSVLIAGSGVSFGGQAHAATVAVKAAAPSAAQAALFDKTRVILHLALAYGVFHHWVYNPWKAKTLNLKHPVTLVKAGVALLYAVHEVNKAYAITKGSHDAILKALNGLLGNIVNQFTKVGNLFKGGAAGLSDAQISTAVSGLGTLVDSSNKILNAPDVSILPNIG